MPESERLAYDTVGKFTAQRGERLITQIHPDRFVEVARSLGFDVLDSVSPEEQFERYFQGREDGLSPTPEIWLFHLAMP